LGLGPELVLGGPGTSVDDDALQLAVINLTLSFVRKFRNNSHEPTLEPGKKITSLFDLNSYPGSFE